MKAVVFHAVGDIRLDEVPEPKIEAPFDAIVRLCASAICGTDIHLVRGTVGGMKPGTILGHEGVGIVEEVGADVRNLSPGDRVVIPSTIACGDCRLCRQGLYSQCDRANPNGPEAGSAYYGGPARSGPFSGLQAERARVPYAPVGLVHIPEEVSDEQAIFLSDIFPTAYFGAQLVSVQPGETVVVFGLGPVGQLVVASCFLLGAGRVLAVDGVASRLEMARDQGAEVIDFAAEDPVETVRRLTHGQGADCAIDAVGVDAQGPHSAPVSRRTARQREQFKVELKETSGKKRPESPRAPDAPGQALLWAVEALGKGGRLGVIGLYPPGAHLFPLGTALAKNLSIKMGLCPHRKYIPLLLEKVRTGVVDPSRVLTQQEPLTSALEAYKAFASRQPGWVKVFLEPLGGAPLHH